MSGAPRSGNRRGLSGCVESDRHIGASNTQCHIRPPYVLSGTSSSRWVASVAESLDLSPDFVSSRAVVNLTPTSAPSSSKWPPTTPTLSARFPFYGAIGVFISVWTSVWARARL